MGKEKTKRSKHTEKEHSCDKKQGKAKKKKLPEPKVKKKEALTQTGEID